jgi:hypothetical protein
LLLSELSQALWHCYTHPASAAPSLAVNTDGWRREAQHAKLMAAFIKAVRAQAAERPERLL